MDAWCGRARARIRSSSGRCAAAAETLASSRRSSSSCTRSRPRTAPDALTVFAAMMHTPDGMPVVALAMCYNGPVKDGEKAIAAIRSFGAPIAGEVGPIPYTALQSMLDAGFPSGLQVHWRSEFAASLPDELIDSLVAAFKNVKSPLSALLIE